MFPGADWWLPEEERSEENGKRHRPVVPQVDSARQAPGTRHRLKHSFHAAVKWLIETAHWITNHNSALHERRADNQTLEIDDHYESWAHGPSGAINCSVCISFEMPNVLRDIVSADYGYVKIYTQLPGLVLRNKFRRGPWFLIMSARTAMRPKQWCITCFSSQKVGEWP